MPDPRRFERVATETRYDGRIFTVTTETFRYADGEEAERDIVRSAGAVAVVAHDGEHVLLVRQPREALDEADMLELPAGRRDKDGEPPEQTAARELAEEVGRAPGRLEHLMTYASSVGMTDELVELFLATDLVDADADSGEMERIEVVPWPLADLDGALATTRDAKTIIGLLLLKDRLRA
jgi:ADP-ribose pyrophosphatase